MTIAHQPSSNLYITVGAHRYPVHKRTYRKGKKSYESYRVRLTRDIDPHTGRRIDEDLTAPTLEKLEFKLKERLFPFAPAQSPL